MRFQLFSRVILTENLVEEKLFAGDMGTIVEYYPATKNHPEGYEIEFFAANGDTIAVASVPANILRAVTSNDIIHIRVAY